MVHHAYQLESDPRFAAEMERDFKLARTAALLELFAAGFASRYAECDRESQNLIHRGVMDLAGEAQSLLMDVSNPPRS